MKAPLDCRKRARRGPPAFFIALLGGNSSIFINIALHKSVLTRVMQRQLLDGGITNRNFVEGSLFHAFLNPGAPRS